jgi:UDP-N-acetylmuramoyl-L-alanyl-D-glutamate--2,6-diaminopimelate ligase
VTLRELLEGIEVREVLGSLDVEVTALSADSRRVRPGAAFFALGGLRQRGESFARDAERAGAVAVVAGPGSGSAAALERATLVQVPDARIALARAAARLHREPSLALCVVAVTGTNGKTTTTWLLGSVFAAAGFEPAVIGTTGIRVRGVLRSSPYTTPETVELQALLAELRDHGVRAVAMEMSSHALVQRRGYALHRDVAVFTNLSHDHLDYHGTLEAYLDAKLMLFDGRNGDHDRKPWTAVVNADDPAAAQVLAAAERGGGRRLTFGATAAADLRIADLRALPRGIGFRILRAGAEATAVELPLLGRYNAWNAAAAFAAAEALGIDRAAILKGLAAAPAVPGRLEPVDAGQPFMVAVDYAHTPDALARVLAAAREHAPGRVLLVFGCGGDRDRAKRPVMGRVAAAGADVVWLTSDNPRSEDPEAIAREVLAGMEAGAATVQLDRREAIAAALEVARPGDVVLIAGKGHETTQTIGERVLPFDDRAVARELLGVGSGGPSGGRET